MKYTIVELASALSVDKKAARGLVDFLLGTKPPLAKFRGEVGKGEHVYEIRRGAGTLARRLIEPLE